MVELSPEHQWEVENDDSEIEVFSAIDVFDLLLQSKIKDWNRCRRPGGPWTDINSTFKLIGGRYGLLCELGAGSFGNVFKGWDLKHRIIVALKLPRAILTDTERRELTRIFIEEARLASCLAMAPYVVKVLDLDHTVPFIVLHYCNNGSLKSRVENPYTITDVVRWGYEIANTLSCAHDLTPNYIVHHDLKPENILFLDSILMVADFGGAMFVRDSASLKSLKPYGFTPLYAAPEAFGTKSLLPKAIDVWSLGIILWELVTGSVPFEADTLHSLIQRICNAPLPNPIPVRPEFVGEIPEELEILLCNCLKKDPQRRPTANEIAKELAILGGLTMHQSESWRPSIELGEWVRNNAQYLYKSNLVVLRENLQNAVDAIRMSVKKVVTQPKVIITYNAKMRQLIIHDNGTGMTAQEQRDCFWKPYGSKKRALTEAEKLRQQVIGQFGIGAYASFKVSQHVTVISKSEAAIHLPAFGTSASLSKPLLEYSRDEMPSITFRDLTQDEIASFWKKEYSHGTIVILQLVEPLDVQETEKWLKSACAHLAEQITFQGNVVNSKKEELSTLKGKEVRELSIDISSYNVDSWIKRVKLRVSIAEKSGVEVEICSVSSGNSREIPCKGVLRVTTKKEPKGISIFKHQFYFSYISDSKAWVDSARGTNRKLKSLQFEGKLDLPFVNPDPPREGFDKETELETCALLTAMSWAAVEEIGLRGGKILQDCDQVFDFIWNESLEKISSILQKYPLRIFGKDERITFCDLCSKCSSDGDLRLIYLTDDADQAMRQMARTLATIDNYFVIELDGPEYWRGTALEKVLEGCVGGDNIASSTTFTSVLADEELGAWQAYRGLFSIALNEVIGPGRQLQVARIEPKDIALVVPEGAGIVYANYNNPEVKNLPSSGLVGPDLESKIRSWTFGKVEAGKLEEALTKQGKLLVVQKVTRLITVYDADIEQYVPEAADQFLLIRQQKENLFCLRVSYLCQPHIRAFVDNNGRLKDIYSARFTWVGHVFYFILQPQDISLPTLILEFKTSVILRNPLGENELEGTEEYSFRLKSFPGPALSGRVDFFVLPGWVGNLLNMQRSKKGTIQVSMYAQLIHNYEEQSS